MYVRYMNEGGDYVPFQEEGTKVTFGIEGNSFTVDAAEIQQDSQVYLDVRQNNDGTLGLDGNWYAATITVPPRKYEMVEDTENPMVNEEGETEYNTVPKALPLDMGAVEVVLYPLGRPLDTSDEEDMMGFVEEEA